MHRLTFERRISGKLKVRARTTNRLANQIVRNAGNDTLCLDRGEELLAPHSPSLQAVATMSCLAFAAGNAILGQVVWRFWRNPNIMDGCV